MKFFLLFVTITMTLITCSAFSDEEFGLEELHQAAKTGILHHLEKTGKDPTSVRSYAVGKRDHGAALRIFFTDGSRVTLNCHFHHSVSTLDAIDCH